jgi:4-oxalocrotonate tautomerase
MPLINVTMSALPKEKKEELIKALTKATASITGIPEQAHTVLITELPDDAIGVGGVTLEEMKKNR